MFGMPDYRAHKLFWLIGQPFRLASVPLSWAIVVAVQLHALSRLDYRPLLLIPVIWLIGMLVLLAFWMVFNAIIAPLQRVFFSVVDVVPSLATNADDARQVVLLGPQFTLNRKLKTDILAWTEEDTDVYVLGQTWLAWRFLPRRGRFARFVELLKDICRRDGRQPGQLPDATLWELRFQARNAGWWQRVIDRPLALEAITSFVLAAVLVLWRA